MREDVRYVDSSVVNCDGNGSSIGHPLVFLNLGDDCSVKCPYCSRVFILQD